jgi:hypothetical protein
LDRRDEFRRRPIIVIHGRSSVYYRGDELGPKSAHQQYITGMALKGAGLGNKGVLYAFSSTRSDLDRHRCPSRAGESLHTDGRIYQIDPERGRGHRRSSVAAECVWTFHLALRDPCGEALVARRERCIVGAIRNREVSNLNEA